MSNPRYHWWAYAKAIVRLYPELKSAYDTLHTQRITGDLTRISGIKGGISRPTENTVLLELPPARQREYDAVTKAIELTRRRQNGADRLALIDLVFWKGTHNLQGAAMRLHISYDTAKLYHKEFIRLVGFCYGLEDYETS